MPRGQSRIRLGSHVLVYLAPEKTWLIRVKKGGQLHTHRGYLDHESLVGLSFGSSIDTSLGDRVWLIKPTAKDIAMKAKRRTQVVYPKDFGLIVGETGLRSGAKVVEAGTGSGVLTIMLANVVKPSGHVYSLEARREFMDIAKQNLERAGLLKYVTLINADAKGGFPIKNAELAVIDVGDPWTLVKPSRDALAPSGHLVAITPSVNQMEKVVAELKANSFIDIRSLESMVREYEVRPGATRPKMRMIGHTAYLTFARKGL